VGARRFRSFARFESLDSAAGWADLEEVEVLLGPSLRFKESWSQYVCLRLQQLENSLRQIPREERERENVSRIQQRIT
jgi:hypothetical protein